MEQAMERKFKDLVKSLGLTSKQEIAILELTEAGFLAPLLEDLKNSIETPQSQSPSETSPKEKQNTSTHTTLLTRSEIDSLRQDSLDSHKSNMEYFKTVDWDKTPHLRWQDTSEMKQSQSSTETSEKVLDPITQDLVDQGLSPEEAEEFLQGT
jgi:hypothetical protein